ncbi:hypothetical protein ES708_09022 [subsurface metagenome]
MHIAGKYLIYSIVIGTPAIIVLNGDSFRQRENSMYKRNTTSIDQIINKQKTEIFNNSEIETNNNIDSVVSESKRWNIEKNVILGY